MHYIRRRDASAPAPATTIIHYPQAFRASLPGRRRDAVLHSEDGAKATSREDTSTSTEPKEHMSSQTYQRDRLQARTPLRCPICGGELQDSMIRDLGGVTSDLTWQMHAGRCPEHGWFQAEAISRPPREIFSVNKPFGSARRVSIDGKEAFSFPTRFNLLPDAERRKPVDAFDAALWRAANLADRG